MPCWEVPVKYWLSIHWRCIWKIIRLLLMHYCHCPKVHRRLRWNLVLPTHYFPWRHVNGATTSKYHCLPVSKAEIYRHTEIMYPNFALLNTTTNYDLCRMSRHCTKARTGLTGCWYEFERRCTRQTVEPLSWGLLCSTCLHRKQCRG